jgi:hypothetical protein
VDAFHRALAATDTAGALSLLARELIVFEYGVVDPTVEAYAFQHLPVDMDVAAQTEWEVVTRQVGSEGAAYWVLSTYRITGTDRAGNRIDVNTMETVLLRRVGEAFRIVHFHWSTDDPEYLANAVSARAAVSAPEQ